MADAIGSGATAEQETGRVDDVIIGQQRHGLGCYAIRQASAMLTVIKLAIESRDQFNAMLVIPSLIRRLEELHGATLEALCNEDELSLDQLRVIVEGPRTAEEVAHG